MPVSKKIEKEKDLTVFVATGELTFADQIAAFKEFYEGDPTKNELWDMRAITGNRISSDELRQVTFFTKQYSHKRTGGKTAMVMNSDLDYGLGRMSETFAETEDLPWEIRIFRSMDEALAWMDE
jgi:hypothetical protein